MLNVESSLAGLAHCRLGFPGLGIWSSAYVMLAPLNGRGLAMQAQEQGSVLQPVWVAHTLTRWEPCPLMSLWGLRLVAAESLEAPILKSIAIHASAWLSGNVAGHTNPVRTGACWLRAPWPEELRCSRITRNFPSTPLVSLTVVDAMPLEPFWHTVDTNASSR